MTGPDARRLLAAVVALLAVAPLLSPVAGAGVGAAAGASAAAADRSASPAADWDGIFVGTIEPGGSTETTATFETDRTWQVSDVYVTGPDSDLFSVVSGGGSFTLEPGEVREMTLSFAGDEVGVKNATLVFEEANTTIETPIGGEIVADTGGDGGSGGGSTITNASFGEVPVGQTVTRTVTIPGAQDRDITATASLIGPDADQYRLVSGGGTVTIPAGADHDITIAFTPDADGPTEALVELVPEDDSLDTGYVGLTGTGVGDETDDPGVTLSRTTVDFRDVPIDRFGARYVGVENARNESVTLSLSSTVDGPGTIFLHEEAVTVPANGTQYVPIVFAPEERDDTTGTVTLDGAALSDPLTLSVSGSGVRPTDPGSTIGVISRNLTLRTPTVDDDLTIPFFVRNNASEPIDVSLSGFDAPFSVAGDGEITLDPGEIRGVDVTYDPTTADTVSDTLSVSRSTGERVDVQFTGVVTDADGETADPPNVSVSTTAIDFGSVPVGDAATRTVTVTNEGAEAVEIGREGLGDPFGLETGSFGLDPGESRTLTISFAPSEAGAVTDSLTLVASTAAGTVERRVDLAGVGIDPEIAVTVADDRLTPDDPTTTVTIANRGSGPLSVDELTLPGPFSLSVDAPLSVPAGESVTVGVSFDPSVDTNVTSTLRIASNDADDPLVRRSLRGIAESPTATVGVEGRVSDDEQQVNATVTDVEDGSTVTVDTATGTNATERVGLEEIAVSVDEGEPFTLNVTTADRRLSSSPPFDLADNTSDVGYLSVAHTVPDANVREVSFTFTVPDSRIPVNATTGEQEPGDMALYRYADGEWVELDTEPVREIDGGWAFRSLSPGLSEFAIGRKQPQFEIDRTEINVTTAQVGDGVAIRVLIRNTGGADGIYDVNLLENGTRVDRRQPTVPPNATVRVVFVRAYEEAGQYRIEVNDRAVDTVAVEAPTGNETPTTTPPTAQPTTAGEDVAAGPVQDDGGGGGLPLVPLLIAGLVVTVAVGVGYRWFGTDRSDPEAGGGARAGTTGAPGGAVDEPAVADDTEEPEGEDGDWSEWSDWEEDGDGAAPDADAPTGAEGTEEADEVDADEADPVETNQGQPGEADRREERPDDGEDPDDA